MPVPSDIGGTARVRCPHVIERAVGGVLLLPLALVSGSTAAATCDVTIVDATGTTIQSGAGTVASGVMRYEVDPLDDTVGYGTAYRTRWAVEIDDVEQVFTVPTAIARQSLKCPVGPGDLLGRYPAMSTLARTTPDYQAFIDEAWTSMLRHLMGVGVWPESIVDVDTLVDPVREHALQLLFQHLSLTGDAVKFRPMAEDARREREAAMGRISFRRDLGQTGGMSSPDRSGLPTVSRRSVAPVANWGGYSRGRRVL